MKTIFTIVTLIAISIMFAIVSCNKISNKQPSANGSTTTTGGTWTVVGNTGFSVGQPDALSLSILTDENGTPYVAYSDAVNGDKATVMKFNGSSWIPVGNANGFSADEALYTALAIDGSGTPYVFYEDNGSNIGPLNGSKGVLMQYSGGSWTSLVLTSDIAVNTSISIYNSIPYVAYGDLGYGGAATVMKYSGGTLVPIGNPGFSTGACPYLHLAIDLTGTPYVAYSDGGNSRKATVMKYNSNSGLWVTVGNAGFSAGIVSGTILAIDKTGTPYVAYEDLAYGSKATVMKFTDSGWVALGGAGFSTSGATPFIAIDSNTVYVTYADSSYGYKATVMKYNGTSWVSVGNAGFSSSATGQNAMTIDKNGTPYVVFSDGSENGKVTVMKYSN